ncbi:MAG: RNA 2'-phosphotransferase, partial [Desulfobacterales bacterium]|nr:RNA 2'-phosphotransferase [Desulfobacterales bacterium]
MGTKRAPKDLAKFLSYVLGRRPDEFGLVADSDGFVNIKELLKAVNEEEGWRYVRRGHLDEVIMSIADAPIEIKNESIRAKHQDGMSKQTPAQNIPNTVFTCVKRKAYPAALEKGILPGGFSMVILSSDKKMAEKIGKRRDHEPVMLTINTQRS